MLKSSKNLTEYTYTKKHIYKFKKSGPFLLGEELVLVDFTATALSGVTGTFLPLVWHYHLRKLLLTYVFNKFN